MSNITSCNAKAAFKFHMKHLKSEIECRTFSMKLLFPLLFYLLRSTFGQSSAWELEVLQNAYKEAEESQKNPIILSELHKEYLDPTRLLRNLSQIDVKRSAAKCGEQMLAYGLSIEKILSGGALTNYDVEVTLKALDSAGKVGPAILLGHKNFVGHIHECITIRYNKSDGEFHGDYFRVFISKSLASYTAQGACDSTWGIDLCFPRVCKAEDILPLLHTALAKSKLDPICDIKWVNQDVSGVDAFGYIVGVVMLSLFALCFGMGIYDYYFGEVAKHSPYAKTTWFKCLMAFSFYRNVCEIFSTAGSKKAGQITPIHCIRFFSMSWIIMGHILSLMLYYGANPLDIITVTWDTTTMLLVNSYLGVDSFFFLSGLLLAFMWFKGFKSNPRQTMSPLAWSMFYIHRLIRLSPPYYFLILFYTFVFGPWIQNSPLLIIQGKDNCEDNWWINLVYLTNYIHYRKQCYLVSWYLSTDLQIYIFSPLILVPLAKNRTFGLIVAVTAFVISTGLNFFFTMHYHYSPIGFDAVKPDPKMTNQDYNMVMYNAPYIRCQIYIMGMLVGYVLQMRPKMKINRVLNVVMWLFALASMLAAVLSVHTWVAGHYWPLFWRAFYGAFGRVAWGFGLTWLIISCYYGYGGFINQFMSWNIFVPLGRLTYSAYLIHIVVVKFFYSNHKDELFWHNYFSIFSEFVIPSIALTYFVAIFWSSVFEVSLGKVEALLIGGLRRPPPKKPVEEAPQKDEPPAVTVAVTNGAGANSKNWS